MLIDCDACRVRGPACGDCVVTVLLGAPPDGVSLDPDERAALDVLAASGLVPPLRLVVLGPPTDDESVDHDGWTGAGRNAVDLADGVVVAHRHEATRSRRQVG